MNLDDDIGTIISRGFTERQARFLVLVARHSGVCVMRQYSAFAGVVFGHTTRRFFTKLERLGWVSTYDCARKRARIYHVRHRELYEAIGDAESRLRRPPTVPRALERIMLLDVILKEPDLVWLASSEEKMTHVSAFTAITKDSLPRMTTLQGSYEPVRYFPDQVPIGIHPDGRWILVCLLTQDAKRELRTFLERHLMFLAALPIWMAYMGRVLKGTPEATLPQPEGVVSLRVNPSTGLRDDVAGVPEVFYSEFPPRRDETYSVPVPAGRDIRDQLF
jgi:hypothetical protein